MTHNTGVPQQNSSLPVFGGFSIRSSENTLNINFPVSQILSVMANIYSTEATKSIMISNTGILKKYSFADKTMNNCLNSISESVNRSLTRAFLEELESRFDKDDIISLRFYKDVIHLEVTGISEKTTHDIRILFLALFSQNLTGRFVINGKELFCNNSILFDEIAKNFDIAITADIIVVIFSKFPFYFTFQDVMSKTTINSKFKTVERLRGH